MWPIFLLGGLTTIGVLVIVLPMLIVRGISELANILSKAEVEDDTS